VFKGEIQTLKPLPRSRKGTKKKHNPKESSRDFRRERTLERLAVEQGVCPISKLEDVLGRGAALWRDDAEFEAFLVAVNESRQKGD
jgi:hypothetical protein